MFALDILLQLVGAFYMFSGVMLTRAAMMSRLIGNATTALEGGSPPRADTVRRIYALVLALLTYLSGLGALSLRDVAMHLFVGALVLQAAYLFWIAPSFLDDPESMHSKGRDQSINAFVVFMAATAFVAWAGSLGRLQPMAEASSASMRMTAVLVAVYLGYVI